MVQNIITFLVTKCCVLLSLQFVFHKLKPQAHNNQMPRVVTLRMA